LIGKKDGSRDTGQKYQPRPKDGQEKNQQGNPGSNFSNGWRKPLGSSTNLNSRSLSMIINIRLIAGISTSFIQKLNVSDMCQQKWIQLD
jgi:hypothetical protein